MAGKAPRRIPLWLRVPVVMTLVLAGLFASSAVWGLTGSGGGHAIGGGSRGGGEHGRSSGEQLDGASHGGDRNSDGAGHGSGGDADRNHGLGSINALTGTAPTTL